MAKNSGGKKGKEDETAEPEHDKSWDGARHMPISAGVAHMNSTVFYADSGRDGSHEDSLVTLLMITCSITATHT
jgi:hypothetical protein